MAPLSYAPDQGRIETDEVLQHLERGLSSVYLDLGYEVVFVPVRTLDAQVELILQSIC